MAWYSSISSVLISVDDAVKLQRLRITAAQLHQSTSVRSARRVPPASFTVTDDDNYTLSDCLAPSISTRLLKRDKSNRWSFCLPPHLCRTSATSVDYFICRWHAITKGRSHIMHHVSVHPLTCTDGVDRPLMPNLEHCWVLNQQLTSFRRRTPLFRWLVFGDVITPVSVIGLHVRLGLGL